MSDTILIDGDEACFLAPLGNAQLFPPLVKKGPIEASGTVTFNGSKICIKGDEESVKIENCQYIAPPFTTPGKGTLTIKKLHSGNVAKGSLNSSTEILLQGKAGNFFTSQFEVKDKAKMPPPANTPDPAPVPYSGIGYFKSKKNKKKFLGT